MGQRRSPAALGFAPHSGWAACVALGGDARAPLVIARERIALAPPDDGAARQPYHAVEALPLAEAERAITRFLADATARALAGVEALAAGVEASGYALVGAGVLHASGRTGLPLAAILASHALIHAAEGDHFRLALAKACLARGLTPDAVRERELRDVAERTLRRPQAALDAHLRALGRAVGPPWGADQKRAALLAWLRLAA